MKSDEDGYTLTEMLVVIGIIGLLAAALTPVLVGQLERARVKAARLQLENLATSLEMYRTDVGLYPTRDQGLAALVREPDGVEGWVGPYVRNAKGLDDPWGRPVVYEVGGSEAGPRVASFGADGKPGGRSVNADISAP